MINAPDRRTFISGLGAVTAGLKVGHVKAQPMSNSVDLILYRGKLTRDFSITGVADTAVGKAVSRRQISRRQT